MGLTVFGPKFLTHRICALHERAALRAWLFFYLLLIAYKNKTLFQIVVLGFRSEISCSLLIDKFSSLWFNDLEGFVDLTACLAFLSDCLDVAILSAATPSFILNGLMFALFLWIPHSFSPVVSSNTCRGTEASRRGEARQRG